MSGKNCDAGTHANPTISNSKAMCEGRAAAIAGALIGTNPHVSGSPDAASWDAGWNSAGGGAAEARDCCADLPSAAP